MMGEEWCLRKVLSREEEVFKIIVVARVKAAPDSSSLLIEFTIFSKSIGVMFFSLPLLSRKLQSRSGGDSQVVRRAVQRAARYEDLPDRSRNRRSALRMSILCMELGSTLTMEYSEQKGIWQP